MVGLRFIELKGGFNENGYSVGSFKNREKLQADNRRHKFICFCRKLKRASNREIEFNRIQRIPREKGIIQLLDFPLFLFFIFFISKINERRFLKMVPMDKLTSEQEDYLLESFLEDWREQRAKSRQIDGHYIHIGLKGGFKT